LSRLEGTGRPWAELLEDPESRASLAYVLTPLRFAEQRLGQELPAMLGLTVGFNALDGD